jgi:hypothetical protein
VIGSNSGAFTRGGHQTEPDMASSNHIVETRRQLPVLDLAVTVFVESLTGIEQGARTGLASCFTGVW